MFILSSHPGLSTVQCEAPLPTKTVREKGGHYRFDEQCEPASPVSRSNDSHDALGRLVLALRIEFSAQVYIKIERPAGGGRLYEAIW